MKERTRKNRPDRSDGKLTRTNNPGRSDGKLIRKNGPGRSDGKLIRKNGPGRGDGKLIRKNGPGRGDDQPTRRNRPRRSDDQHTSKNRPSHGDDQPIKSILKEPKTASAEKKKFDFERNERTIFVGNIPSTMDHREVEKLFKACGAVESARIRSIVPEKEKLSPKVAIITQRIHPKVNSVNAYVVFAKTESLKKALAMNGKVVDGHHIRVDRAQHPNSKRMTLTSRKKSVFVGNLRFDLRDDDLIAHFVKAGEVDYVRLVRDKATGLGKGFGFVKFMERAAVKKALEMNESDFKGRPLRVKKIDEANKG